MLHNKFIPPHIRKQNSDFNKYWIEKSGLKGDDVVSTFDLDVDDNLKMDSSPFMVVWLKNIDRLCGMLGKEFDFRSYSLLDVGCGSGISTLYFKKKYPFRRYLGFDFSRNLIDTAMRNKEFFLSAKDDYTQVSFQVIDARVLKLPAESFIIFMFNPFGWETMSGFLENNVETLRKNRSAIIYANDIYVEELCSYGRLIDRDDFYNLSVVGFSE